MSNIDKRAQKELYAKVEQQAHSLRGSPREYQALTGLCPVNVIEMHAQKIQALLDELEAADNNLIDSECHVAELEEALRDKQALLEASEQRIAELESLMAPQLPQPAVMHDAATAIRACLDYFPEGVRDIVEECAAIAENACRAAMLQCSEPVTDNTNQQFESLSRGDK